MPAPPPPVAGPPRSLTTACRGSCTTLQAMLFLAPVFSPFIIGVFSILCTSLAHVCPKTDSDLPFPISNTLCILSHILERGLCAADHHVVKRIGIRRHGRRRSKCYQHGCVSFALPIRNNRCRSCTCRTARCAMGMYRGVG